MSKKSTLSFADLTGGKKRSNIGKKKMKKAAKYHLEEMKISKKKFRKIADEDSGKSLKKARAKYRREHADELADILLGGHLKNSSKYEEKLQEYIEDGKLFDASKRGQLRKVAKRNPGLFAYAHIVNNFEPDVIKSVMKGKVNRLSEVVDEKAAIRIAPLASKSNATKVLRVAMKIATEKDSASFDAKDFFKAIRPKDIPKKQWREIIVSTVFGIRGHSNNALKDVTNYTVNILGEMPKDRIKKLLKKYADSITRVADSGEKLNFLVTLKDLSDNPRVEKVLNNNPKIANVIGQL